MRLCRNCAKCFLGLTKSYREGSQQTFGKCNCKYTTITIIFLLLHINDVELYPIFVNIFCNEFFCCLSDAIIPSAPSSNLPGLKTGAPSSNLPGLKTGAPSSDQGLVGRWGRPVLRPGRSEDGAQQRTRQIYY